MRYKLDIYETEFKQVDWFNLFRKELPENISMQILYSDSDTCNINCIYGSYTKIIEINQYESVDFDSGETNYSMEICAPGISIYDDSIYNFEFEFDSAKFLNHMIQQDGIHKTLQSIKNVLDFKLEQYKILMSQYGADFSIQPIIIIK